MSDDPTDTGKDVPADTPAQEVNAGKADGSVQSQQVDGAGGDQEAPAPVINGSGQPDVQGQSGEQVAQQGTSSQPQTTSAPGANTSASTLDPAAPAPTSQPTAPPSAGPSQPPTRPAQPDLNSPLPRQLQQQFYARFRVQPPATHGELQRFLLLHQRQQAMQQGQQQGQTSAGPGAGPGQPQGTPQQGQGQATAGQPNAQQMQQMQQMQHLAQMQRMQQLQQIQQNQQSQMMQQQQQNQAQSVAPPAEQSSQQAAGTTQMDVASTARPSSRPGSSSGTAAPAVVPPLQVQMPSSTADASATSPANGQKSAQDAASPALPFAGQFPPGMDRESILRQMRALQESQQHNRRPSLSAASAPQAPRIDTAPNAQSSTGVTADPSATPSESLRSSNPLTPFLPNGGNLNLSSEAIAQTARLREAQVAKAKMLAQQHSGAAPNGMGVLPAMPNGSGPPETPASAVTAPPSAATARSMTNEQHVQVNRNFANNLQKSLQKLGVPFPPQLFPVDPANPQAGPVGVQADVMGTKIDLMKMWYTTMQGGGHQRMQATNAWPKLAQLYGIPDPLPQPQPMPLQAGQDSKVPPQTTISAGELLASIYMTYLAAFEDQWREGQKRMSMAKGAQSQAQTGQAASSSQPTSVTNQQGKSNLAPPAASSPAISTAQASRVTDGPASAASPATEQPGVTAASTPGPDSAASSAADKQKKRKKPTKKELAAMALGDTASVASTSSPSTPTARAGSTFATKPKEATPPPAKRRRYKVEYVPLQRELDTVGGWDVIALTRDLAQVKASRTTASVEDLGRVDIEGLGMSLRSRIGSEVSYALTALLMLSMPGQGEEKGGLGLVHCGELLSDLVDLVESAAFGEEGWEHWDVEYQRASIEGPHSTLVKGKWPEQHDSLVELALDAGRSVDASILATLEGNPRDTADAMSIAERCKITLVGIGLLRNFSVMNDNYLFMTSYAPFLDLVARLCDLRLASVPGLSASLADLAIFSLADLVRIRKDVLQILTNLAWDIRLPTVPLDTSKRYLEVVTSFLTEQSSDTAFGRMEEFSNSGLRLSVPSHQTDLAVETLSRLALSDANRLCLRQLPEEDVRRTFLALTRLLPLTAHDLYRLCTHPLTTEFQTRLAVAIYNFAFLSSTTLRATMRSTSGLMSLLTRIIRHLAPLPGPPDGSLAVIGRRLSESISLLNSNDGSDLATAMTFGSRAGPGGWQMSQGESADPGLLAHKEDLVLGLMDAARRKGAYMDGQLFRDLDRAVWAG